MSSARAPSLSTRVGRCQPKSSLWPSGADGSGWPCPTFTRIPVGRPKTLSCSYVPAAGAASPGAWSGRCAIMQLAVSCRTVGTSALPSRVRAA